MMTQGEHTPAHPIRRPRPFLDECAWVRLALHEHGALFLDFFFIHLFLSLFLDLFIFIHLFLSLFLDLFFFYSFISLLCFLTLCSMS